ncbi:Dipeptidyl-peptidase-like protein 1 [Elsinoe fawcettii]|nr:Dipeptidyl-peptidase-like protein 1 [Elsinoe fawcettii]
MPRAETEQYVHDHFHRLYEPAHGRVSSASQPATHPYLPLVAFTGSIRDGIDSGTHNRICVTDLDTGSTKIITADPGNHRYPQWSSDGVKLAYISDEDHEGVFQVRVMRYPESLSDSDVVPSINGTVEAIQWSSQCDKIMLLVADLDSDRGAVTDGMEYGLESINNQEDAWMPVVHSSTVSSGWRRLWMLNMGTSVTECIDWFGGTVWEACWLGASRVLAVVSDQPGESTWYSARLAIIDLQHRAVSMAHQPIRQIGCPTAEDEGDRFAVIEALASDRGGIAGDVRLFDAEHMERGSVKLDLNRVDITQIRWHKNRLYYIGLRSDMTVAGVFDPVSRVCKEYYNDAQTCGSLYPELDVTFDERITFFAESWNTPQQLLSCSQVGSTLISSLAHGGSEWLDSEIGDMERISWSSSDGETVHGYLCHSARYRRPGPVILNVHGGPVWTFRNKWQLASPVLPLLVRRGYAVLSVNYRGSAGHGQAFCERVIGDAGGIDADDVLCGVQYLIQYGIAVPGRVGLMGASYGGFLSAWLPTQTSTFAASVPIAPITNWASYHNTTSIRACNDIFLGRGPPQPNDLYFSRSPVNFAGRHPTPIMQIVGGKDTCVPSSQAQEYHNALIEAGVRSELVMYPQEGHSIQQDKAYMDLCARILDWFDEHLCGSTPTA